MPLPMQGEKLLPGVQNIARRRLLARAPHRGCGDVALDADKELSEAETGEFRVEFGARGVLVGAEAAAASVAGLVGEAVGDRIDQRGLEPAGVGVAKFGFGKLL